MNDLISKLVKLKEDYGIVGIKQSFEDEGARLTDVQLMRSITKQAGVNLSVKIGGCEAKTDIKFCTNLDVDGIVAPMDESPFAVHKFITNVDTDRDTNYYVNIETGNATEQLYSILKSPSTKLLTGFVVGRSDLVSSLGLDKSMVDHFRTQQIIEEAFTKIKEHKFKTLMGGNITSKSSEFIQRMYSKKLLDVIETRNVIIELNDDNINNLDTVITESLKYELEWVKFKLDTSVINQQEYVERIKTLENRLFV